MDLVDVHDSTPTALQGLGRLAPWRQGIMLVALAATVAVGVAAALWLQTPAYSLLQGNLSGNSAAEVLAALKQAGIPFRVQEDTGAVMVPSDQVREARLKLAAGGLPRSSDIGMEMLQQEQTFGTSQFRERARYQRALEVELARTIADISPISAARVHLALPRRSPFLRNRRKPSASVFVSLRPGRRLAEAQVATIAQLVAAAVPNLESSDVTVTDEKGRLLTLPGDDAGMGLSLRQLAYKKQVEADKLRKIERILSPVAGANGFAAEVTAELDFTRAEQTRESFDPDSPATRSRQIEEESGAGFAGGGVPGALSNQPPAAASVPEEVGAATPAAAGADVANASRRRRKEVVNNELDRTVSHTQSPSGKLLRLSVAVVLDDHRVVGAGGAISTRRWTPEELARIESQVKTAIGFDAERGDSLGLTNSRFMVAESPEPLPEPVWWKQPWVWDGSKQIGVLVLALVVLLGVLRPLMRNLVSREIAEREQRQAEAETRLLAARAEHDESGRSSDPDPAMVAAIAGPGEFEAHLSTVRDLVHEDPARVANVMKNWVAEDG